MLRNALVVLCVAFLLTGCVAVTEPLSDPDKAEPDKRLLGKWQGGDVLGDYEIDSPVVKGQPKGLMRAVHDGQTDGWFFTTTIGKHTYATMYIGSEGSADFSQEGAFEKWNKGNDRCYFIVRYSLDGDKLTVDGGNKTAVQKLMKAEKFERIEGKDYILYKTPPGWLATYFEKTGPQTLYDGTNAEIFRRPKK